MVSFASVWAFPAVALASAFHSLCKSLADSNGKAPGFHERAARAQGACVIISARSFKSLHVLLLLRRILNEPSSNKGKVSCQWTKTKSSLSRREILAE